MLRQLTNGAEALGSRYYNGMRSQTSQMVNQATKEIRVAPTGGRMAPAARNISSAVPAQASARAV